MLPLILGGAALVGGALWLFSGDHGSSSGSVPKTVVDAVARAIKSGDPEVMHDVATSLRKQGYAQQAASLESAAKELDGAINATPRATPGRALLPGRGGINPAPRADSSSARKLAGQLAQLLSSMALPQARADAFVKASVTDYQNQERRRNFYVGNIDGLYGPKSALTLAQDHGIVPPRPLYWPKKDPAGAKSVYRAQLARFADADPQRREEWQQAMHVEND